MIETVWSGVTWKIIIIIIVVIIWINETIQSSPIAIQKTLNILYIFYDLEYMNGDRHIVGLIVYPHIPIVSGGFKIQIKKN